MPIFSDVVKKCRVIVRGGYGVLKMFFVCFESALCSV